MNLWYSGSTSGALSSIVFVPGFLLAAAAQLTVPRPHGEVYDRTESLLVATLMHGRLIASTALPIVMPSVEGSAFLAWFAGSAAALWLVVGAVALMNHARLSR